MSDASSSLPKESVIAFSRFGYNPFPEHSEPFPLPVLIRLFGLLGEDLLQTTSPASPSVYKLVKILNAKRYQCMVLVREQLSTKKVLKVRPRDEEMHDECDVLGDEFELLTCLQGKHHVIPVEQKLEFPFTLDADQTQEIVDVIVFPYIYTCRVSNVPYSYQQLWIYMNHLFEALSWCHANNIIHADVKPDNVLFAFDGEDEGTIAATLIDFGAACRVGTPDTYERDTGTFILSPPELLSKSYYSTPRDVWAAGISVLWTVYGTPPFGMEDDNWDLYDAIRKFVNSAAQDEKPWPSLCDSHPTQFDCKEDPSLNEQCGNLQKFLVQALKLDPNERISAKDAMQVVQQYI